MVSRPTDDLARGSALAGYYASPDSTQARPTSNAAAAAARNRRHGARPVRDGTAGTLIVGGVTLLAVVAWRWRRFRAAAAAALLVGLAWVLSGLA